MEPLELLVLVMLASGARTGSNAEAGANEKDCCCWTGTRGGAEGAGPKDAVLVAVMEEEEEEEDPKRMGGRRRTVDGLAKALRA